MRFLMKTIIAQLILTENKIICAISHANRYSARAENKIKLKIPMSPLSDLLSLIFGLSGVLPANN